METIIAIEPYRARPEGAYSHEAGFQIKTNQQTITLAIDDEAGCCERWGYFMSEDDFDKFIGCYLLGVSITDTNRTGIRIERDYDWNNRGSEDIAYYDGDVMFVDIETSHGVLQFVAYNCHNGYYGHRARVKSKQLTISQYL